MNHMRLSLAQLAKPVEIVGVACGEGARNKDCAAGPDAVRAGGLVPHLQTRGLSAAWRETIRPGHASHDAPLQAVHGVCRRLAQRVRAIVAHGGLPVVVGGDHSCAIGTWKGVASALRARGPLGLIWIDAHMDAHTPQTTPSGALHGMPLACLLGHGDSGLTALGGGITLQPQYVCLIGVRSYETSEAALLRQLGVRIYYMYEVARRGLAAVLREALAAATTGTAGFGVTLDLDAIDPRDAPGVNTPVADGIRSRELAAALECVSAHSTLAAIEIAEYNPERDRDGRTGAVVTQLLDAMLPGPQQANGTPSSIDLETELGAYLLSELHALKSPLVRKVRGRGLLIGVEIDPALVSARTICRRLLRHGVLSKDTHHTVVRFAPPLIITREQIDGALTALRAMLAEFEANVRHAA